MLPTAEYKDTRWGRYAGPPAFWYSEKRRIENEQNVKHTVTGKKRTQVLFYINLKFKIGTRNGLDSSSMFLVGFLSASMGTDIGTMQ